MVLSMQGSLSTIVKNMVLSRQEIYRRVLCRTNVTTRKLKCIVLLNVDIHAGVRKVAEN